MKNRLQKLSSSVSFILDEKADWFRAEKKTDKMKKEPKIIDSTEETPAKSCQLLPGGFAGTIICPKSSEIYKNFVKLK